MTTKKINLSKTYEYVVIGSDLSAYVCAQELFKLNKDVILVPYKDSLEDFSRTGKESENHPEPFSFLPVTEENLKLLNWLEDQFFLEEGLFEDEKTTACVTFEEGKFKEFLGFGERKLSTLEDVSYYSKSEQINLLSTPQHWLSKINTNIHFPVLEKSTITKMNVEAGALVSININNSKDLKANQFIFCGPVKALTHLLDNNALKGRPRQKIAKAKVWSRINLSLHHSEFFMPQLGMHILSGTKDDFEPVVGQFLLTNEKDTQLISHWTYLLDPEEAEDPEIAGGVYKYIKRQIKRAYPEAFEKLVAEKVSVHSYTHGKVEGYEDVLQFKTIKGLSLLCSELSSLRGPLAGLDRALTFLNTLQPVEATEEPESHQAPAEI